MFIRENKTKNKKTGKTYVKHVLIESYRTEAGPRQRVIMNLGELTIPKKDWKKLAFLLENMLSGNQALLEDETSVNELALEIMDGYRFLQKKQKIETKQEAKAEYTNIDLESVSTTNSRSLGPELVANTFWEKLGFTNILKECGLKDKEISLAKATIIGRLISPDSEQGTLKWLKERTSLIEMLDTDISEVGKNALYNISDRLFAHKETIERSLRVAETTLFPDKKMLFLYDLTNTYFEGTSQRNDLTHRCKSKEKRNDCQLVTLALLVDSQGFPIFSHIYKGNQGEPETLEDVFKRLEKDEKNNLLKFKSTIVMDRGIATKDNIQSIKKKGYPYIVIERRAVEKDYVEEFETAKESFEKIENSKGDTVYVKKIDIEKGNRVLCLSEKREAKENAMDSLRNERFIEDFTNLQNSISKGSIKLKDKVFTRVGRLKQKYSSVAQHYEVVGEYDESGTKVTKLNLLKKESKEKRNTLTGCYVIETSHEDLDAREIWKLYTTLTQVESSFKALKTDLGMRPVHHQISERIKGHLFISVLAYHILNSIEVSLVQKGCHKKWSTIKKELSTHQRNTVIMTDDKKKIHHIRVSGMEEKNHYEIYELLEVKNPLKKKLYLAGSRL